MNALPVEAYRLPRHVLLVAEGQNLVERGILLMDNSPLYGGVCICSFDDRHPVLIGQRDWTRIHHVYAEPLMALLDMVPNGTTMDAYIGQIVREANEIVMRDMKPHWVEWTGQLRRAIGILNEYRQNPYCADKGAVTFTILKLWKEYHE